MGRGGVRDDMGGVREGGVCEGVSVVSRESQPATLCGRGMPFSLHATAAAAVQRLLLTRPIVELTSVSLKESERERG